jgi:hypothetical protein
MIVLLKRAMDCCFDSRTLQQFLPIISLSLFDEHEQSDDRSKAKKGPNSLPPTALSLFTSQEPINV